MARWWICAAAVVAGCDGTTTKDDGTTPSSTLTETPEEACDPAGFSPCGACLLDGCESECRTCAGDRACVGQWDDYDYCVSYMSSTTTTVGGGYTGTDEGDCFANYIAPFEHANDWYQCQLANLDACFDICSAGTP